MNIIIESLRITDIPRRLSKTVNFKEKDNLITSEKNSRGKSVLMKSIYHAMGADSMFDNNFNKDSVLFELSFRSGENAYRILRYKDNFSIVKNGKLIYFVRSGSRTDLSAFFQEEFGTSVFLKNRKKTKGGNTISLAIPKFCCAGSIRYNKHIYIFSSSNLDSAQC